MQRLAERFVPFFAAIEISCALSTRPGSRSACARCRHTEAEVPDVDHRGRVRFPPAWFDALGPRKRLRGDTEITPTAREFATVIHPIRPQQTASAPAALRRTPPSTNSSRS